MAAAPQSLLGAPRAFLILILIPAPPCGSGFLQVSPGPTSLGGAVGQDLTLECLYRAGGGGGGAANVSWYRLCTPGQGCGRPLLPLEGLGGAGWRLGGEEGRGTLTLLSLSHNDSGLYFCRVEAGGALGRSCGTFVRVHTPRAVPLFNLPERTKDQVLRAQGALLLLSAAGPGLLLLLRRRARQQLQPQKGPSEEENLYEGLTLDTCSMYEDISGGVLQATYQDVGTSQGPPQAPPQPPGEHLGTNNSIWRLYRGPQSRSGEHWEGAPGSYANGAGPAAARQCCANGVTAGERAAALRKGPNRQRAPGSR
ncbi:B-cell antigen receptor complex-associated protein alpha chain [Dryobates pubescens]|uniref:B-cell antigen receptor complex-associated protein alpha chain n=1 Tax=Dryobates pubescens TaxID=118200 RepID=UPI0023BA2AB6|nr:B-cell antigen receptor complex-associated protein alpha chain [Dryobates pubescens]